MITKKLKYSDKFDSSNDEYEKFLNLDSQKLIDSLNDQPRCETILSKIGELKKAVDEKLIDFSRQKLLSQVKNTKSVLKEKYYVAFYKDLLNATKYSDNQDSDPYDNSCTRTINSILEFTKKKVKLEFNIEHLDIEGDKLLNFSLYSDKTELISVDGYEISSEIDLEEEEDESSKSEDNSESSEKEEKLSGKSNSRNKEGNSDENVTINKEEIDKLIKIAELDDLEKRGSKYFLKDLILAILAYFKEKYKKEDYYSDLSYGINEKVLKEILF